MRAAIVLSLVLIVAVSASADSMTLKGGKKVEGVIVDAGDAYVVNPYNSRWRDMTYGITEKERISKDKLVGEVLVADPPLVAYREWASDPARTGEHLERAKFCEANKLAEERDRELKLALCADPSNAEAIAALGRTVWAAWSKGNPLADSTLAGLEREYVGSWEANGEYKGLDAAALEPQWAQMLEKGTTRQRVYLERARRSAKFPYGRRDKVPLTLRSELSPGANYCIYIPKSYDPLVPAGLVVGLHGGGPTSDPKVVTGNGQEAMNFYVDVADERGVIVVCPSALEAGWAGANEPFIDALIEEMKLLYNVDEHRIWLTGHSMGGGGAWHWGPLRPEVWAAFSPCAGYGGGVAGGLPVYIYHGSNDTICPPDGDRRAADNLKKEKADFVYTEVNGVGHAFPDWVRHDIFRFFTGHWKDDGKKHAVWPKSSFDRKVSKEEIKCFGNPAAGPSAADDPADSKLAELVAALEKGGGRGVEAGRTLASRKDAKTVAAVGKVLHSKKVASDAKVIAAQTIGDIGLPDGVKLLASEIATDDFRILDAIVESLGKLGGKDAAEPLVRAAKQCGVFFDTANKGNSIAFTEYEGRCQSFGRVCDAMAVCGDAALFVPVLDKEIVQRVYAPAKPYAVPIDERFVLIPPRARLDLMQKLRTCLVKMKDPRGKAMLAAAKGPWAKAEPRLAEEADAGIAEL